MSFVRRAREGGERNEAHAVEVLMAGFSAVWSIDIGKFALKAVHLRRVGMQVIVQGTERIEYDIGPEGVDSIGGAREALQIFTSRNSTRDPFVVCLPGQDTLPRFIKIVADDEKKLQELVNFEARQQIPFPIQEVVWDWQLVPRDYAAGQEREVGIFAARRETVDDLLLELDGYGIRGQQVICGDLGLLNFVLYELRPKAPSVILDVGAEHTALILVDNGAFWIRALPFSGNQITRDLSQRFRLTFAEAERVKRQAAKSPQKDKIFAGLQKVLGDFTTEVQRSVAFYRRQIAATEFETAYLLGQGSFTLGLGQVVQERLGWKVQRVAALARMRPADGLDVAELRTQISSLAPALGAGLQGLGLAATNVDLMPREQRVQLAFTRKRKMVFIAGGVLLGALVVLGQTYAKKAENARVSNDKSDNIVKQLEGTAKQLAKTSDIPLLKAKIEALAQIGQERPYFSQSLAEVNKLFAAIEKNAYRSETPGSDTAPLGAEPPRARTIFIAKQEDENEAEAEALRRMASVHKEMAWLLSLQASLKGVETERPGTGAATTAKDQAAKSAPAPLAYVFTLTGAVLARETPDESRRFVDAVVVAPLSAALKKNRTLAGHITSAPRLQLLDQTALADPVAEEDRQFARNWLLVDPRFLRDQEKKKREPQGAREGVAIEEDKYYLFSLTWTVSEKAAAAAAGASSEEPEESPAGGPAEIHEDAGEPEALPPDSPGEETDGAVEE